MKGGGRVVKGGGRVVKGGFLYTFEKQISQSIKTTFSLFQFIVLK